MKILQTEQNDLNVLLVHYFWRRNTSMLVKWLKTCCWLRQKKVHPSTWLQKSRDLTFAKTILINVSIVIRARGYRAPSAVHIYICKTEGIEGLEGR